MRVEKMVCYCGLNLHVFGYQNEIEPFKMAIGHTYVFYELSAIFNVFWFQFLHQPAGANDICP